MTYTPTNWKDFPDTSTPLEATPLNNMEAGIVAAYVQGAGGLKNIDIDAAAAIVYSKLVLTGGVVDADISALAAITLAKLAGYPNDATKYLSGAGWATLPTGGQKIAYVPLPVAGVASSPTNVAWETANAAILWPFTLQIAQTIAEIDAIWSTTMSGNFDVGVYNLAGTRMVSKGSTAQSTLSQGNNRVTIASTPLAAGQYWLALACDNTTGAPRQIAAGDFAPVVARKIATSFPLPSTLTVGSTSPTNVPLITAPLT